MRIADGQFRIDANGVASTIAGNILPIIGVLFAGWDIYTLLIAYWCETLIIGFWTIITAALHDDDETGWTSPGMPARRSIFSPTNPGLILFQTGFMLALHLFLMSRLYGNAWPGHLQSVSTFIETFLIGQAIWPALAFLFLQRAAMFWQNRNAPTTLPTVADLYLRVTVMQIVIIFGAGGVMLTGSGMLGLVLLAGLKTLLDLRSPRMVAWVVRNFFRR